MGICEILTVIFVICKLLGVISWSWWLVLLPELIAIAFYITLVIINVVLGVSVHKSTKRLFK